ncbi:MAG: class I SAM-dependent methyltransferase [Acidimicrobiales bacterium]
MTSPGDAAAPTAAGHWDEVYATRDASQLSWYQREPVVSLRLIASRTTPASAVVDVGAGESTLVDALAARGYRDLTAVDLSRVALDRVAARAGSTPITLVEADVLTWRPAREFDLWHDRALFHFLVDPDDQRRYVEVAAGALGPGGAVVLATFALDGPSTCSGLAVARHDAGDLAAIFAPAFALEANEREVHHTPAGGVQSFTWVVLRRGRS